MIEIAVGMLVIAAVLALLGGAGTMLPGTAGFDPLPLVGYGGVAGLLVLGLVLVTAGGFRRAIARNPARRAALRSSRLALAGIVAVAALAVGAPLTAELFNLVRLTAIPLGYYAMAEGALIGIAAVAFAWAARQQRIEQEEDARE